MREEKGGKKRDGRRGRERREGKKGGKEGREKWKKKAKKKRENTGCFFRIGALVFEKVLSCETRGPIQ